MKLPKINLNDLNTQELGDLKDELHALDKLVDTSLVQRERDHQFPVTNSCALEFLANTEARFKEIGVFNSAIGRLALLMFREHHKDLDIEDDLLTQDDPWCTGDYEALRYFARRIVESSLTRSIIKPLLTDKKKSTK